MVKHLTEAEKKKITDLYKEYGSVRLVAARTGVSIGTVSKVVRTHTKKGSDRDKSGEIKTIEIQEKPEASDKDEDKGKLQAEAEVKIDKGVVDATAKNAVDDISKMVKEGILPTGKKAYLKWIAYEDRLKALGYNSVDEFIDDVFERTGNAYIEELKRRAEGWEQDFYMLMALYLVNT